MDIEKDLKRMEAITEKLKLSDTSLKEALELFEEGSLLAKNIEKELADIEQKVAVLVTKESGEVQLEPFEK